VSLARLALAGALLATLLGCVGTVAGQRYPALAERREPIRKVAVAPIAVRPEQAAEAAPLVARHLAEALAARGIEVVAPEDVAHVDTGAGVPQLAAAAARQFGADALLVGEITRWVEREGEAMGSQYAAAVGIRVVLHGAPGGERLWHGEFDHTQQAMLENVLLTPRYPGGGTRWLSADEFAHFASDELAAAMPVSP
jgi:nucleotide-binding universal stress UspA family protein